MPSRLSLRLQQRACLARAVAVPTEILYLDNPLAGLGPRDARWWTEFLREQRGAAGNGPLTIVATCNDFRPWLEWATQFALVREGRFHALGNREQVLASDDPGVRELL
jgi:ABC-type transporter Mla maintaining outer membrane lipid asymmetry ATPase subunit MlaF